jgi:O-antigen/teichoic acid export membrane protein
MSSFRRRLQAVVAHSLPGLLLPLFNALVALLVIRLTSVAVWGAFVYVLVIVQLGSHVVYWGNKEYLLRAFSRRPGELARLWQTAFFTRSLLFVGFVAVMVAWAWPLPWLMMICLWGAGLVVAQSFEVLVLYRRAFLFRLAVELGAVVLIVAGVFALGGQVTAAGLLALFALAQAGKASAFALRFRRQVLHGLKGRIDPRYLVLASPFFLLGFTGLLQSRIDLYSVAYFLDAAEVGRYQVLTGFLLYIQALANFILLPFAKALYRLDTEVILRISRRLLGVGAFLVPPAILALGWLLRHVYQLHLSHWLLVVGGLYALSAFVALPIIYSLYKADLQRQVLHANVAGTVVNLGLNILWIPLWGLMGALLATTLTSWLMATFYWYRGRRLLIPKAPSMQPRAGTARA